MIVIVNGVRTDRRAPATIREVVIESGAKPEHVAVLLNGDMLPRAEWDAVQTHEGDRVEILAFVGGG